MSHREFYPWLGYGHVENHAPHEGHDECLAVVDRIASGLWSDRDRFRPLPKGGPR